MSMENKPTGVLKLRGAVALKGFQGLVGRVHLADLHDGNRKVVSLLLEQNLHAWWIRHSFTVPPESGEMGDKESLR